MKYRKGKAKSGAWFTRDLLLSQAYLKLSATGKFVLGVIMLKRDMNRNHECLNSHEIFVTYKELENRGMSRGSVANAFSDLLAKGFVKIMHQGGAYKQDKTQYGITNEWSWWKAGDKPVRKRPPGRQAGYHALKEYHGRGTEKIPTTEAEPIHTTGVEL